MYCNETILLTMLAQNMLKQNFDENKQLKKVCTAIIRPRDIACGSVVPPNPQNHKLSHVSLWQQSYLTTASERRNRIINQYWHSKWNCVVGYVMSILCEALRAKVDKLFDKQFLSEGIQGDCWWILFKFSGRF